MDLRLSDEERLLQETVQRYVADTYDLQKRDGYRGQDDGWSWDNWSTLAEMGLLGLMASEEAGGFGGGSVEAMLVLQAMGRGLTVEPFLPVAITSVALLGNHALVGEITAGSAIVASCLAEPGRRYTLMPKDTTSYGATVSGTKNAVMAAPSATHFIVPARDGAGAVAVYLVAGDAVGVSIRSFDTQDGQRAGEVTFAKSPVAECLASGAAAEDLLNRAADATNAALCAEASGIMAALLDMTGDYMQTRNQFGRPLAAFQVLQHRLVDMRIHTEEANSMALMAAKAMQDSDETTRMRMISAAKTRTCVGARWIGQQAIQLHGGMGMTREYGAGEFVKRLAMIEVTLGDADHHTRRFTQLMDV